MEEVGLERYVEYSIDKSFSMHKAQKKAWPRIPSCSIGMKDRLWVEDLRKGKSLHVWYTNIKLLWESLLWASRSGDVIWNNLNFSFIKCWQFELTFVCPFMQCLSAILDWKFSEGLNQACFSHHCISSTYNPKTLLLRHYSILPEICKALSRGSEYGKSWNVVLAFEGPVELVGEIGCLHKETNYNNKRQLLSW